MIRKLLWALAIVLLLLLALNFAADLQHLSN
jgi:hypothetical protein